MDISVLLLAPQHDWRDALCAYLVQHGFDVQVVDGIDALTARTASPVPALVLLAEAQPRYSGTVAFSALRRTGCDAPVIMLGSGKPARADGQPDVDHAMEKIICLELGADDYLDMPCNPRELLSRIRNVLRHRPTPMAASPERNHLSYFGDFLLDRASGLLTRRGGAVKVQGPALALLQRLAAHPMEVLSRPSLIAMLHRDSADTGATYRAPSCERSLDVVVCRLRQIIESDPSRPKFVQTVRGFGYVFNPLRHPGSRADEAATPTAPLGSSVLSTCFSERSFPRPHRGFSGPLGQLPASR